MFSIPAVSEYNMKYEDVLDTKDMHQIYQVDDEEHQRFDLIIAIQG